MPDKPITVAETPLFVRQAAAVWDDAEREAFIQFIARHPDGGRCDPGNGWRPENPLDAGGLG